MNTKIIIGVTLVIFFIIIFVSYNHYNNELKNNSSTKSKKTKVKNTNLIKVEYEDGVNSFCKHFNKSSCDRKCSLITVFSNKNKEKHSDFCVDKLNSCDDINKIETPKLKDIDELDLKEHLCHSSLINDNKCYWDKNKNKCNVISKCEQCNINMIQNKDFKHENIFKDVHFCCNSIQNNCDFDNNINQCLSKDNECNFCNKIREELNGNLNNHSIEETNDFIKRCCDKKNKCESVKIDENQFCKIKK